MNNSKRGYILLHRKIWDNFLFNSDERYDRRIAWIFLLFCAFHTETQMMVHGATYTIQRGQFLTTVDFLAAKWKWDRKTVLKYLATLQREGMIKKTKTSNGTIITIVNYDKYQNPKLDELDGWTDAWTENSIPGSELVGAKVGTHKNECNNKCTMNDKKKNARARADGRVIE